ncbi:aspartic protease Bla g 2-like [Periplaneta americana]|uniref:aspartic protease Bla g 2-like n=1 Tax=Periplaneta americana TaxID=6978 RepID=UPI0037E97E54
MTFLIQSAFVALAAISAVLCDPVVVPLQKREPVEEYINTQYVGPVQLGNQYFLFIFDTSSYTTVVPSASCVSGGCNCVNVHKYYSNQPVSNNVASVKILGSGYASGSEAHDYIAISTLNATNQGFLLADDISTDVCALGADGVIALGRPKSGRAAFDLPSVMENFADQDNIANSFSFHHGRYPDGQHRGVLVLGGTIPAYYTGEFTYVPFVDNESWNFKVDSVSVGNEVIATDKLAFVDSSKYVITGPSKLITIINNILGCSNKVKGARTLCVFDCDKLDNVPSVTFTIGGVAHNISSTYHIQQNGDVCYSGFQDSDEGDDVIHLGDFFTDNYYGEFDADNNRMGIAKSVEEL